MASIQDSGTDCLLCSVETRLCALPLASVREVMRPLACEALAEAPQFVRGLAIIRGQAAPVIELATLLGARAAGVTRFVALRVEQGMAALAVDEVLGVRSLSRELLSQGKSVLGAAVPDAVRSVATLDSRLLLVLDAVRLVPDATWELVRQARAS